MIEKGEKINKNRIRIRREKLDGLREGVEDIES